MITYNTEIMNHRKENSTCVKSGAHKAPNRCSGAKVVLKARTVMPALRPREYLQECPRLQHIGHTELQDDLRPLNILRDQVFPGKHHPR
jgi:hypothetical protein